MYCQINMSFNKNTFYCNPAQLQLVRVYGPQQYFKIVTILPRLQTPLNADNYDRHLSSQHRRTLSQSGQSSRLARRQTYLYIPRRKVHYSKISLMLKYNNYGENGSVYKQSMELSGSSPRGGALPGRQDGGSMELDAGSTFSESSIRSAQPSQFM